MTPRPLHALLPALLVPMAVLAEDPKPAEWKGTLGAGLIVLSGNSNTTTFTGSAAASRETLGWAVAGKAAGAYGTSRPPQGGPVETTALKGNFELRLGRKLGQTWSFFGLGGVFFDHVASVEYRSLAELGAGAQWLDVKEGDWQRLGLRTDLGLRHAYEARRTYYPPPQSALPGKESMALHAAVDFRWGFSKDVSFTEVAEVVPDLRASGRVLLKAVSKLSSRLAEAITFGVGYTVTHDTEPAPGKVGTDMALTAILEVGF